MKRQGRLEEDRAGEVARDQTFPPILPLMSSGTNTLDTEIETRSSMSAAADNLPMGSVLAISRPSFPISKDRIVSQQILLSGQANQEVIHVQIHRQFRCRHQAKAKVLRDEHRLSWPDGRVRVSASGRS